MKKIKGFTLIELMVAIAIMAIITTAAIQFLVPVNKIYNDVSSQEKTMAITNGISRYIGESIRYSKYIMIYSGYSGAPDKDIILKDMRALSPNEFSEKRINDNELSEKIKGLYLDNTTPITYNNKIYKGRVYKLKNLKDATPKLALTSSYYGNNTLYFSIPKSESDDSKLNITSNTMTFDIKIINKDGSVHSTTENNVDFLNMNSRIKGQINYKTDTSENIYIYYYVPQEVV